MLKMFNKEDGFVLLESLLGLSIVAFTLIIILPHGMSLMKERSKRQAEVEGYRLMYDYSQSYEGSFEQEINRAGFDYQLKKTSLETRVILPNEEVIRISVVNHD